MVVFDTATLVLLIDPQSKPPLDPATKQVLTHCKQRIDGLLKQLSTSRTRVLIPTPVLSEFLVKSGPNKDKYLTEFLATTNFLVGDFDQRAAIELACLEDNDLASERQLNGITSKAKVKFDRQIISIAKVQNASTIYTGDNNLATVAKANGLRAVMTWEIPLPPEAAQQTLHLDDPNNGN